MAVGWVYSQEAWYFQASGLGLLDLAGALVILATGQERPTNPNGHAESGSSAETQLGLQVKLHSEKTHLKKLSLALSVGLLFSLASIARAQQMDFAFGISTISSPAYTNTNVTYPPQSLTGGIYPAISGDFLLRKHIGIMGEISWRGSQGLYNQYQPYRPIFWDFNGLYLRDISKRVAVEGSAGIGAESTRFYTNYYNCNYLGCTPYATSTHFMGQFGAGLKLYAHGGIFVRPEVHFYLVHNNVEYSSSRVLRYGASIGYTFGGR
jgi:hypothetical protein